MNEGVVGPNSCIPHPTSASHTLPAPSALNSAPVHVTRTTVHPYTLKLNLEPPNLSTIILDAQLNSSTPNPNSQPNHVSGDKEQFTVIS